MSAGPTEPSVSRVESLGPKTRTRSSRIRRQRALLVVGAAISAVSLWLALRGVSLDEVWTSLEQANWVWVLPALALTYLTLAVRAVRWRYLFLEPENVSTWESAKAINVGLLFNNILPSRAGEVSRIFALARRTGVSKVEIGGTIVVDRLLDLLTISVAALIVWPWLPDAAWVQVLCIICSIIVGGFVATAIAMWVLRQRARLLAEAMLRRLPFVSSERAGSLTASFGRGVHIFANPGRLTLALALSAVVWTITAASALALFPAFDLSLSISSAWLIIVATSLAMTVPSTSGGLGVYEAAVQTSLVAAGTSASTALSFALVLHAINFAPISITGALAAWDTLAHPGSGDRPAASIPAR
jgi:glycosyltransferase 2 family protein